MNRAPALFIGHGSPMNTLESNRFTSAWREFGRMLGRPRALLDVDDGAAAAQLPRDVPADQTNT